jgi:4'-phosphopantetheinyl transferase
VGIDRPELNDWVAMAADDVQLWTVPLAANGARLTELVTRLTGEERGRADRFLRAEVRRRFIVARASLRSILGRYLDMPGPAVPIEEGAHGKPQLAAAEANDLRFNLAHSGELALVAVTRGCEVGVDVEQLRPIAHWQEIAARYFHPAEVSAIEAAEAANRNAAFLNCWTQKEAILKAHGVGLGHSLQSFAVPVVGCEVRWVELFTPASSSARRYWLQAVAPCAGYIAAVATELRRNIVFESFEHK